MNKTEGHMIDPSDMELAAMRACLSPLGEYVGSIGMQRPLADYSRDEVLMLIDVVVTAYQDAHARGARAHGRQRTVPFWRNVWRVSSRRLRKGCRSDAGLQSPPQDPRTDQRADRWALASERDSRPPRNYLGASRLGVACERALAVRVH
jgi:hypothetical protein